MQNNAISTIARSPDFQTERVIRKWLLVFSELFARELTPFLVGSWCELLGDLPAPLVEAACSQVAKTCRFFPAPGEIRAQIDGAETKGFELQAEREWQLVMAWAEANVYPDGWIRRGAQELAPEIQHAAKAAGGVFYLQRCNEDQLVWAKKAFLVALKNVREAKQTEHLLTDGVAKRILRQLSAGPRPVRKSIAPAPASTSEKPSAGEVREFLKTVSAERPQPDCASSIEDFGKNWESQKARLAARAAELEIPTPPKNVSEPEAATR